MLPTFDYSDLRFGLYARKSTEGDERQAESIDDQTNVLRKLAEQNSLVIRKIYSEACSAKEPYTRDHYYRMIDDLKKGVINAILCWHVDRLSRNPIDSGQISWLLQRGEIKLVKTPYREYRPEDNVMIFQVDSSGANQQIIDLSRNVKRGLHEKAGRGLWPQGRKPGYKSVEIIINGRTRHRIEVDPKRFALLRRAWELMLTGSYTGVQVMRALNSWGYRSRPTKAGRPGGPMSRAKMYDIFKDPFYYGCFSYVRTMYQGSHRPMVTKAEFDEVRRIIEREHGVQPQKHEFPFTGLIRCGICKNFATAEQHIKFVKSAGVSRAYVYYHCGNAKGCRMSVTQQAIESHLTRWLQKFKINSDVKRYAEAVLARDLEQLPTIGLAILKRQKEAHEVAQKRLDALFEMRQNGEITAEEFVARKSKSASELTQLESAIESTKGLRDQIAISINNGLEYLFTAYDRFTKGGWREKRQVATLLAEEYTLTYGQLTMKPNRLLDLLRVIEPPMEDQQQVRNRIFASVSPGMSG